MIDKNTNLQNRDFVNQSVEVEVKETKIGSLEKFSAFASVCLIVAVIVSMFVGDMTIATLGAVVLFLLAITTAWHNRKMEEQK